MPRGDRTGPIGWGPMTGRGAGFCAGADIPGFMNRDWQSGGGPRRGRGGGGFRDSYEGCGAGRRGGRRAFAGWPGEVPPPPIDLNPRDALAMLKQQAAYYEQALIDLQHRIAKMASSEADSKNT